jgi:hypothetical protein
MCPRYSFRTLQLAPRSFCSGEILTLSSVLQTSLYIDLQEASQYAEDRGKILMPHSSPASHWEGKVPTLPQGEENIKTLLLYQLNSNSLGFLFLKSWCVINDMLGLST